MKWSEREVREEGAESGGSMNANKRVTRNPTGDSPCLS